MHPSFTELLKARHSVRDFLPDPVAPDIITRVLNDARLTPSNSNTQPWNVHIVSGKSRDKLSQDLLDSVSRGRFSPDFSYAIDDFSGVYLERARRQGEVYHAQQGVDRHDQQARMTLALKNYEFFGAPHVALLFMPGVGDHVRTAADIGMYGQTFLLSLVAHGLAGIPQTSIGMAADTVRESLGIEREMKLLFAIAFGYPTETQANKPAMEKAGLEEMVTYHH